MIMKYKGIPFAFESSQYQIPKRYYAPCDRILSPSGGMAPAQFDTLVRSILVPTNDVKTTVDTVRNVLILNGTVAEYRGL